MTDHERIRQMIAERPYLVVNIETVDAQLLRADEAIKYFGDKRCYILDVSRGLSEIEEKILVKEEYTLNEIAMIARVKYQAAYYWVDRDKILSPSLRAQGGGKGHHALFSYADAYAVGIMGALRRLGAGLHLLKLIQPLFSPNEKPFRSSELRNGPSSRHSSHERATE
jgi:hypothetical protein